jgi:hypothetical protein
MMLNRQKNQIVVSVQGVSPRGSSMRLNAVPYAPSVRLDDRSFQDAGCVRMGRVLGHVSSIHP